MKDARLAKALKDAYYSKDQPYGFSTATPLYKHVKKTFPTLTLKQVKEWLKSQEVATRFKLRKTHFKRTIFTTRKPHQQWCADLLFPMSTLARSNEQYTAILIVQDLFSRFILGLEKLKNKKSENVALALEKIIRSTGKAPHSLSTDSGLEFFGACQKVYDKYNIKHFTSHNQDMKQAVTERANLVVKHKLSKIMAAEKTLKWIPYLEDVRNAYNKTYSRILGMSPQEAIKPSNIIKVYQNSVMKREDENYAKIMGKPPTFKKNSLVRISQKHSQFSKSTSGAYSEAVYKVIDHPIRSGIYVYILADYLTDLPIRGSFLAQELQEVKDISVAQEVKEILSYRLSPTNKQELLVKLKDTNTKKWIPYSELIKYASNE